MRTPRTRRIVALAAAYLVALQAVLLPLAVAQGAAEGIVCASVASQPSDASHTTGCPCAAGCGMQCCAGALTVSPPPSAGRILVRARSMVLLPAVLPAPRLYAHNPQCARAPPAA